MDLIDIWHFALSAALQNKHGNTALVWIDMLAELNLHQKTVQFDNQYYVLAQLTLLEKLDLLVGLSALSPEGLMPNDFW